MSSRRIGKYACLELERRYLLRELPADLVGQVPTWLITDRYLIGTRLRLRRMMAPNSGVIVLKFGQKYRAPSQSAAETTITNMYLNDAEYYCLSQVEAKVIVKKRHTYVFDGLEYRVDCFEDKLAGLVLAEIECETTQEFERCSRRYIFLGRRFGGRNATGV